MNHSSCLYCNKLCNKAVGTDIYYCNSCDIWLPTSYKGRYYRLIAYAKYIIWWDTIKQETVIWRKINLARFDGLKLFLLRTEEQIERLLVLL